MLNSSSASAKPKNWQSWFKKLENSKFIDRSRKADLFKIFDATISEKNCIQLLLQHEEVAFLYKQNVGQHRVNIFHHLKKIGGTIYNQNETYGAIEGVSQDTTSVITPDVKALANIPLSQAGTVPKTEDFMSLVTIENIQNLSIGNNENSFLPRNFIPIPPFLIETVNEIIENNDGDASQLLLKVVEKIRDFDDLNLNDEKEEAKRSCSDLLFWLYLVIKNKIHPIPTIGCTNKEMRARFKSLFAVTLDEIPCNNASPSSTNQVDISFLQKSFEVIASNLVSTQKSLSKLTEMQSKASESISRLNKKVPPCYQQMILVASSQGSVVPTEINKEALEFFASENRTHAQLYLNSKLESYNVQCTISPALSNLLGYGHLLWTSHFSPSGLSTLVISPKEVFDNDPFYDGIVLDLSTKFEMSKASLNKLTKTQISIPSTIEEMMERVRALFVLSEIFFGKASILTSNLNNFMDELAKNKLLLKTSLYSDDLFILKFLYHIDHRVHMWLKKCARYQSINKTCVELIRFDDIIHDIQRRRFILYNIPSNIMKIAISEKNKKGSIGANSNKRQKIER